MAKKLKKNQVLAIILAAICVVAVAFVLINTNTVAGKTFYQLDSEGEINKNVKVRFGLFGDCSLIVISGNNTTENKYVYKQIKGNVYTASATAEDPKASLQSNVENNNVSYIQDGASLESQSAISAILQFLGGSKTEFKCSGVTVALIIGIVIASVSFAGAVYVFIAKEPKKKTRRK